MAVSNEELLNEIEKKLYEVDGLLTTPIVEEELGKNNINLTSYLGTIELYLSEFDFLMDANKNLLKTVNEYLRDISSSLEYIEHVSEEASRLEIKFSFLKKHEETFFGKKIKMDEPTYSVTDTVSPIKNVNIQNFFSIKDISLAKLEDKKEIYIVGENGDGKTLFLQATAIALVGIDEGDVFNLTKTQSSFSFYIEDKDDFEYSSSTLKSIRYNNLLAYGSSRNNYCQIKEDMTGYLSLFSGEYDLKSPTKWLQYLDYNEQKENDNVISVAEAIKLLQHLLNREIEINISPNKVIFMEKGSEVSFEQLSAGYRGIITIICDLISRFSEKQQVKKISDFQGVVLIDEVELHLHPKWQYTFMSRLRETFPLIQFIVTTHSPTVLLGAGMEAVYYHIYKEEGVVKISEQKEVKNDFLNDIQTDIFGFDVNDERINHPSSDDKKRQQKAKEALSNLIDTIGEEQ